MDYSNVGSEARIGAKWWANKLREGFELNNGSADEPGTIANMGGIARDLTDRVAEIARKDLTPDKVDAFEVALGLELQREIDRGYNHKATVGVDYGPDMALEIGLRNAGIDVRMGVLPFKTHMHLEPGRVSVGDGYGAPWVDLQLEAGQERAA